VLVVGRGAVLVVTGALVVVVGLGVLVVAGTDVVVLVGVGVLVVIDFVVTVVLVNAAAAEVVPGDGLLPLVDAHSSTYT
jgi:hypothetical protein